MQVFCHSLNPAFYCNSIACQSLELAFLDWWTGGESNEVKAKTSGAELRVVKRYYSWENKRPWKTCFNSSARTSVLKSQIGEDPVCIKLGLFPLQQTAAFSKWCRSVLPQTAMRAWSALSSKHRADKQKAVWVLCLWRCLISHLQVAGKLLDLMWCAHLRDAA